MFIDAVIEAYIEAMLWAETDENEESLDKNYDVNDISAELMAEIRGDCEKFVKENETDLQTWDNPRYTAEQMTGHDFWLTRRGHGAGFWDGDWEKTIGERLTESAKKFGDCEVYIGDDSKLYSL